MGYYNPILIFCIQGCSGYFHPGGHVTRIDARLDQGVLHLDEALQRDSLVRLQLKSTGGKLVAKYLEVVNQHSFMDAGGVQSNAAVRGDRDHSRRLHHLNRGAILRQSQLDVHHRALVLRVRGDRKVDEHDRQDVDQGNDRHSRDLAAWSLKLHVGDGLSGIAVV